MATLSLLSFGACGMRPWMSGCRQKTQGVSAVAIITKMQCGYLGGATRGNPYSNAAPGSVNT
eukprot:1833815-Amphidinium_carterae.1